MSGHDTRTDPAPGTLILQLAGVAALKTAHRRLLLEGLSALLAARLALAGAQPRAAMAALLWPDVGAARARANLRQRLLRLRSDGVAWIVGDAVLSLAPAVVVADIHDPAAPELLQGLQFDAPEELARWLDEQRAEQRQRQIAALAAAAREAEHEHRWGDALAYVQRQIAIEPLAEAHHRALMRLHYLTQDVARAREAFETLREMLQRHYGVGPSAETMALLALTQTEPAPGVVAPQRIWSTALLRPPRLIGRDDERALLLSALDSGQAILVLGEAGLGKSRLLMDVLSGEAGCVLAKAQAGDAGVPYATLARLLREVLNRAATTPKPAALARLLPELGPVLPLPADGERLLLLNAVQDVLAATRLRAIAVDDLHFADEATLEMLASLVSPDGPLRLAWLMTQRPGEGLAAAQALRDRLEEAAALQTLALQPLTQAQTLALLQSLDLPATDAATLAPRLHRHTGGNPLFVLETLKPLLQGGGPATTMPLPAAVGTLIDRRLRQLSDPALALARVAAIAGPDFSPRLAEAVLGRKAVELVDAWRELESAQVLKGGAFAHDLVLDAVHRSLPAPIAAHLHAAVADDLQAQGGEPARTAMHWQAADELPRAAEAWMRAGEVANQRFRRLETVQCFESAAALFEQLGDAGRRFEALCRAASEGGLSTIDHERYLALVERLQAAAHDPASRVEAAMYVLRVHEQSGDVQAYAAAARGLIEAARTAKDEVNETTGLLAQGMARVALGELDEGVADYRRTIAMANRIGNDELLGIGWSNLGTALHKQGDLAGAREAYAQARPALDRAGLHERLVFIDQGLAAVLLAMGHAAASLEAIERVLRLLDRYELSIDFHGVCRVSHAQALRVVGRLAEALATLDQVLPQLDAQRSWVATRVRNEQAQILTQLGRYDLAQRTIAAARVSGQIPPEDEATFAVAELQLALLSGRARGCPPLPEGPLQPRRRVELQRLRSALLEGDEALEVLADALRIAEQIGARHERRTVQALMAQRLSRSGAVAAAEALMRAALAEADVFAAGYPPALALLAWDVLQGTPSQPLADAAVADAHAWIAGVAHDLAPEFRSSFFERNPVNQRLRALRPQSSSPNS